MFWRSLSLLQRSGILKRWYICVTGGYLAEGMQLAQAHVGSLQQYWEINLDLTNVLPAGTVPNHPSSLL